MYINFSSLPWKRLATDRSQFNLQIIEACISGAINYGREVVMLQAGASFFAYEPVLQALKNAPIPFEKYITKFVDRKTSLNWEPGPPSYLLNNEQVSNLDFSSVLSPSNSSSCLERRYTTTCDTHHMWLPSAATRNRSIRCSTSLYMVLYLCTQSCVEVCKHEYS